MPVSSAVQQNCEKEGEKMSKPKGGLGKGLGSLFGEIEVAPDGTVLSGEAPRTLPMTRIEPNQDQPRKVFDPEAMQELTESIKMHGLITPITVRKRENGLYQIIAGERRWRAARSAGLMEIPAHIIEATDQQVMELAMVENLQRQDLNPIEEAEGFEKLMESCGLTQEEAAERVGRSRPAVANSLRLLSLSPPLRDMVAVGKLSSGHARALLSIKEEERRLEAAEKMQRLTVRQAESLAKRMNKKPKEETPPAEIFSVNYIAEVERSLEGALGRKVTITQGKNAGSVALEFYGSDDLERLIQALKALLV